MVISVALVHIRFLYPFLPYPITGLVSAAHDSVAVNDDRPLGTGPAKG